MKELERSEIMHFLKIGRFKLNTNIGGLRKYSTNFENQQVYSHN